MEREMCYDWESLLKCSLCLSRGHKHCYRSTPHFSIINQKLEQAMKAVRGIDRMIEELESKRMALFAKLNSKERHLLQDMLYHFD